MGLPEAVEVGANVPPVALQVTPRFCESLVTVAVRGSTWPTTNPPRFGVTETLMLEEPGTVSVVDPDTPLRVADMVVVPAAIAVAKPPVAIVAVAVLAEAQVTLPVRFCVLESE